MQVGTERLQPAAAAERVQQIERHVGALFGRREEAMQRQPLARR